LRPINPEKIISSKNMQVHVNNIQRNTPFYDSSTGISIQNLGGSLQLTTNFGLLSLTFGGQQSAELSLDSKYAGYVCGLCGDGDGNPKNDFVDRNNKIIPLVGDYNTKFFRQNFIFFFLI
jgi:hypothetical protein